MPPPKKPAAPERINATYLESLIGYNARRAALTSITLFMERMAVYNLRPVDLSVLSLIAHNPGITSRQICTTLSILPPNLVGIVAALDKRGVIERQPHPYDGRAMGLHLTEAGEALTRKAEHTAAQLEAEVGARLTPAENKTLIRLLKKIYL